MTKLKNIKAVGFDLDDTLVMSEGWAFVFENEVLAKMGRPPQSRLVHQETWGIHLAEAIKRRSPGIDVDSFTKTFRDCLKDRLENHSLDELTDEVEAALIELGRKGIYLFILTGRDGFETAHLTIDDHPVSLHIRPEDIYHNDNLKHPKPDPRAFDWLADKGLKPHEVIFVGDSVNDGLAAAGAGLKFVATLESGLRQKSDFKGIKVTAFINRLPELLDIIA